jgi:hypothetical protein
MPEESSSKIAEGGAGISQKETGTATGKKSTNIKGHIYDCLDVR